MKVLVFPKETNPYQELLYENLRPQIEVEYLTARFDGPLRSATFVPRLLLRLFQRRIQGFSVLHVHWLYTLAVPNFVPLSKQLAYFQTLIFLYGARILGYKLVWTAHNVLPHSKITSNDLAVRSKLVKLASYVIVHSSSTIDALAERGITLQRSVLIPHGNYAGVYANTLSQAQARKKLSIPAGATVISLVGALHGYKNVPELVTTFARLAKTDKSLYLILAGRCKDLLVHELVAQYTDTLGKRLQLYDMFIPDDAIQLYLNAADVCAFPFTEITTSGSVLLATTFGKPIVAPYRGALTDLPKSVGVLYEPTAPDALYKALKSILKNADERGHMAAASAAYAETLSWDTIAKQTLQLYEQL